MKGKASRVVCPVCDKDVAARSDGTVRQHFPPGGGMGRSAHCRGAYARLEPDILHVRLIGPAHLVADLAVTLRGNPRFGELRADLRPARDAAQVRLYLELLPTGDQQ